MRGIAEMVEDGQHFASAWAGPLQLAHHIERTLRVLETQVVEWFNRVLKILVSVVRFRPWPPFLSVYHRSSNGLRLAAGSVSLRDAHAAAIAGPRWKAC